MSDREKFDIQLTAGISAARPEPFGESEEEASFMALMGTPMPGRAG